jgi:hypothetical protein
MRTRTTGRAGQQQARSPIAGRLDQATWSSGYGLAAWSPGNGRACVALRRGNLILIEAA